ncbi:hypothetical protein [Sinisalibacter aestuarii]|uniref:Uncharacterized protein n=1 Tax=Sinisalibacter aestuarii TaxID=2949426 RepID=A0ABQ5LNJ6_9RHOB|nr:hypothetical protein [Sinisalibacter aestuarii]GKY86353.1 hypothetical protein STA1M1_02220 [Sinisalibacter aestuarii]
MSDVITYDPANWFWLVAETGWIWSSRAGAYVEAAEDGKLTRIASEAELSEVLAPYGLPGPRPRPVEAWCLHAVLDMAGLSDRLEAALDALTPDVAAVIRARLRYAPTIDRFDPAMDQLGAALGLSAEAMDDLWWQAAAL